MHTPEATHADRGRRGRKRRTLGQLWQVPTFFLGLLAMTTAAVSAPWRLDPAFVDFRAEVAQWRASLALGLLIPDSANEQIESRIARLELFPSLAADVHFLAGLAYDRLAVQTLDDESAAYQAKAIDRLEEAMAIGLSDKDLPQCQFRLGVLLNGLDRDSERALTLMEQGVDRGAEDLAEGYGLLVKGYLQKSQPDLDAALAASQKQLEKIADPQSPAMAQARLTRAEILVRRDKRREALRELDRIGAGADPEIRLQARQLQVRCAELEGMWQRALTWWQELLDDAKAIPGGKARILLAIGYCHTQNEPPDQDAAEQAWQEALKLGGPEGQAAGLRLGELMLTGASENADSALKIWTQALTGIESAKDYRNPYFDSDQVRMILEQACRQLLDHGDFDKTRQAAELYRRVALPGRAEQWLGKAAESHAKEISDQAAKAGGEQAKNLREQSRALHHRAAEAYAQAGALVTGEAQAEFWWRSAVNYQAAKNPGRTAMVLEKFVRLEENEFRLAEGWYHLAEAYQDQGQVDSAQQAYFKVIEYPTSPLAYRARYELALREIERKNYDQARAILQQNLGATSPTMDREAHEKSIYKMASLLLQMQVYDQAAWYLKEATRQYPFNANVLAARDQLGHSYRKLAEQAQKKLEELNRTNTAETLSEEKKKVLEEKRGLYLRGLQGLLEQALESYQMLTTELDRTAKQRPLTPTENAFQRKAQFTQADLRFEMNDFAGALSGYQTLQARYRGQVESLIACYKIWGCVGVMVQTPEARQKAVAAAKQAVEHALADLAGLAPEHPSFNGSPDIWTKAMWEAELRRIQGELLRLAISDQPKAAGFPPIP